MKGKMDLKSGEWRENGFKNGGTKGKGFKNGGMKGKWLTKSGTEKENGIISRE